MKSCISTYSFYRLYGENFTLFDAIEQTKKLGCDGVEFVLNDNPPAGYTVRDYALALTERAHSLGLEAVSYTHLKKVSVLIFIEKLLLNFFQLFVLLLLLQWLVSLLP